MKEIKIKNVTLKGKHETLELGGDGLYLKAAPSRRLRPRLMIRSEVAECHGGVTSAVGVGRFG